MTMLKNKCSVWKKIKFPTFWYNCYYFTWSDTFFIQLETLLIKSPLVVPPVLTAPLKLPEYTPGGGKLRSRLEPFFNFVVLTLRRSSLTCGFVSRVKCGRFVHFSWRCTLILSFQTVHITFKITCAVVGP